MARTKTTIGRTWHFVRFMGRNSAVHNLRVDQKSVGGFTHPYAISVAPDGMLFVLSRGNGYSNEMGHTSPPPPAGRVSKTTIDEDHLGDFARADFIWPSGIAVASDGYVYCADEYRQTIGVYHPDRLFPFPEFDPGGESVREWGEHGSKPGQFDGPTGIDFDSQDNLHVVDSRNNRIQVFTTDGGLVRGWGGSGEAPGQFKRPWGIHVDKENCVFVADWGNDRVQKFTPDGQYLMAFGSTIEDGGDLYRPADVAVDSDGDVYITDWGNRRVQIYEPNGDIITALYGDADDTRMSGAAMHILTRDPENQPAFNRVMHMPEFGRFGRPTGIALTRDDHIAVCDTRGRVQVYKKDNEYMEPEGNFQIDG